MDGTSTTLTTSGNDSSDDTQPALSGQAEKFWWKPRRKILVFVLLSFVYFLNWCCVTLLQPFFPNVAETFGLSSTVTGLIFGTYSLVSFLSSLVYGSIIVPRWGPYFVLFCGLFLNGGANIIFGFLNLLPNGPMFAGFCFLVRAVGAVGGAACETAVMVILIGEFRENLPFVMGMLELSTGLGLSLSPVITGVLYTIGGFKLPFLITGGFLLLVLPLLWFALPRMNDVANAEDGTKRFTIKNVIVIPGIIMMCMTMFISQFAGTFVEAILAPFATKLGVDSAGVGLLFLGYCVSYTFCAPVVGKILQKKEWQRFSLIFGLLWVGVCLMFLGPAPFLTAFVPQRKLWLIGLSLSFAGIGYAALFIAFIPELMKCCHERGFPKDTVIDSLVSGLFNGLCNLGGFVGPVFGGFVKDHLGFAWTSTITGFLLFGQAAALAAFFSCNRRRLSSSNQPDRIKLLPMNSHSGDESSDIGGFIE